MKTNFLKVSAIFVMLITLLASCAKSAKTELAADEDAAIRDAFNGAYTAAIYFSGYAENVSADGSIEFEYDNPYIPVLQYDRFAPCGTMAELDKMLNTYFTSEIAEEFSAIEAVIGEPLFREENGVLYRYSTFNPLYPVDVERIEIVSVTKTEKNSYTVSVKAEYPDFYGEELATVAYDYTCESVDGTYKFTGEFPLLADIAIDEMLERNFILPLG